MIFTNRAPIRKGWSYDQKYCATTADGTKYLLRISPPEKSESRTNMFRMLQKVAALDVPICKPVEFGLCEEGFYTIHSWIDGDDAESVISGLSGAEQYAYGLDAGRILHEIHSIPSPSTQEEWENRFNRKMDDKIRKYADCPIHYENGQAFIHYMREHRHLLKGRPQVFQHGDYHIGNMMIDKNKKLQIIDFDRYDFGDPWEEFNRIVWCARKSPLFASGMVDGYFEGEVPFEFWKLLALYIASNALSSICWAIPFGRNEVNTMLNLAKDILHWYDNMRTSVPKWYINKK